MDLGRCWQNIEAARAEAGTEWNTDFRAGVVGLGRAWYGRTLADPDNLAGHPAVQGVAAGTVNTTVPLTTGLGAT